MSDAQQSIAEPVGHRLRSSDGVGDTRRTPNLLNIALFCRSTFVFTTALAYYRGPREVESAIRALSPVRHTFARTSSLEAGTTLASLLFHSLLRKPRPEWNDQVTAQYNEVTVALVLLLIEADPGCINKRASDDTSFVNLLASVSHSLECLPIFQLLLRVYPAIFLTRSPDCRGRDELPLEAAVRCGAELCVITFLLGQTPKEELQSNVSGGASNLLHHLVGCCIRRNAEEEQLLVWILFDYGYSRWVRDVPAYTGGRTCLHLACFRGKLHLIPLLISLHPSAASVLDHGFIVPWMLLREFHGLIFSSSSSPWEAELFEFRGVGHIIALAVAGPECATRAQHPVFRISERPLNLCAAVAELTSALRGHAVHETVRDMQRCILGVCRREAELSDVVFQCRSGLLRWHLLPWLASERRTAGLTVRENLYLMRVIASFI